MTTTFVLGKSTITKDMVFGWVIVAEDGRVGILKQESSILLQELLSQSYPAYMQGFVEDCKKYLQEALQRETQASLDTQIIQTLIPELPDVRQQAKMRRQAEILGMKNFLEDMFQKQDRVEIDYGSDYVYAIAVKGVDKDTDNKDVISYSLYTVTSKVNKPQSTEGYIATHASLQELAQSVCNRWW